MYSSRRVNRLSLPGFCRRIVSFYWLFAFPLLVWTGLQSLQCLDHLISLNRVAYDSSPNQPLLPSKGALPGFHNRDARFANLFLMDGTSHASSKESTGTAAKSTNKYQRQSTNLHANSWLATLQQQQQQQQKQAVEVTSRISHPSFVEKLKGSRRELEAKVATASNQQNHQLHPSTAWQPAPTPFNQTVTFGNCFLPPPQIVSPSSDVVILILSSHHNYERRQAIRETWAHDRAQQDSLLPSVYFVVGHSPCNNTQTIPTQNSNNRTTINCVQEDHNLLLQEQATYQDLVEIPMVESYRRLPEKVIQAYHWTIQHVPTVKWLVKADDDTYVRVASLSHYLLKYNAATPLWIGKMIPHSRVARAGKWADMEYQTSNFYPYWAIGSAGHIVSRAIADYVVQESSHLHRYQGEDVSLGIWLNNWQKRGPSSEGVVMVTYIQAERMITNDGIGVCGIPRYLMIGHDLTLDEIYECHLRFGNKTVFHDNTWIEEPGSFEELVGMEEEGNEAGVSAVQSMLRQNQVSSGGSSSDTTIFQSGGSKASYDAAKAALSYNVPPRGGAVGYQYPGTLREHLAKSE